MRCKVLLQGATIGYVQVNGCSMGDRETNMKNRFSTSAWLFAAALMNFCGVAALAAEPAVCHVSSPPHRVALVELYTSEGCSSCPPADDWLRKQPVQGDGPDQNVVALAFHVDYWNSIGWTDRFSDHRYTERQNALAAAVHSHLVYTPEVFVNGHESRNWSSAAWPALGGASAAQPADANLMLNQQLDANGHYQVQAKLDHIAGQHGPVALYIALYQNNLTSQVRAGENSGATLHHVFAVRALSDAGQARDGKASALLTGALPDGALSDLGFVAFAQDTTSGEILQAVAQKTIPHCE